MTPYESSPKPFLGKSSDGPHPEIDGYMFSSREANRFDLPWCFIVNDPI